MKKYKLAFVSPSIDIAQAVESCLDSKSDELTVRLATLEQAMPVAKELLGEGTEVVLSVGATGSLLVQSIGQGVLKIPRTHLDTLRALMQAKRSSPHIGLTSFAKPVEGINLFEDLLGIKIRQIVFYTEKELIQGISRALDEGVKYVVGGQIDREIVSSLGGEGIIIIPSKGVIVQSLLEARAIASARRKEKEETEELRIILETFKEGLIVIDNRRKVKIINQMASELFGLSLEKVVGQPIQSVFKGMGLLNVLKTGLPEIDRICRFGDLSLVVSTTPIVVDSEKQGVVATFKETSRIQSIDRKLRESLYSKGFVAKYEIDQIKGESLVMRQLLEKARKYAKTEESVLIQGETGTGKELLAQSIHNLSKRRPKPFVAINCSALPESLLESELFGYEEGAFTGAKKGGKIGLLEMANGGTVFLDEIADISPKLQAKLIRIIEEKEVMRVGGDKIVPVDIRIVSSSHDELWEDVRAKRFRIDLYFRLAVLRLDIPPLCERAEDIRCIVQPLLQKYTNGKKEITETMLKRLSKYHWPGNIRQLESLIKRYVALLGDEPCSEQLLEELLQELVDDRPQKKEEDFKLLDQEDVQISRTLKDKVDEYEQQIIKETLGKFKYNKQETAKRLGISVNTLWRKLRSPEALR